MKSKYNYLVFSGIVLLFLMKNMYQLGVMSDAFGTSPNILLGGTWVLAVQWLLLPYALFTFIMALHDIFKK